MERITIVMGGASDLGGAIADHLIALTHLVVILDRDPHRIAALEPRYDPGMTLLFALDPSDLDETAEVMEAVDERFGPPTGLVIVIEPPEATPLLVAAPEELAVLLAGPLVGAGTLVRFAADGMDEGGAIVLVLPPEDKDAGAVALAARGALAGFVRGLAGELADAGLRVNAVVAPAIGTRRGAPRPPGAKAADETARLVAFLLSEHAAMLNGEVLGEGASLAPLSR